MTIQPIRTKQDHHQALKRVEELWLSPVGSPEGDELDVLTTLIVEFEQKHYPLPPPDPIAAILFRMEQQNLTRRDLEPFIGSRARVSEVLSGKRSLTLPMIRRLSAGLKIPADILIALPAKPAKHRAIRRASTPSRPVQPRAPRRAPAQSPPRVRRRAS
jgi:HTH-type transcriptional regulator/antitoxin HigA